MWIIYFTKISLKQVETILQNKASYYLPHPLRSDFKFGKTLSLSLRCTKNRVFFFQIFWRDGLSKKNRTRIWSFLHHQEKWYFFSRKYDLILWTENERYKGKKRKIKKNTWKYDVFSILGKYGISSSYKLDITPLSKKQKWSSPEKYPWRWHFQQHQKRWYSFLKRHWHSRLTF